MSQAKLEDLLERIEAILDKVKDMKGKGTGADSITNKMYDGEGKGGFHGAGALAGVPPPEVPTQGVVFQPETQEPAQSVTAIMEEKLKGKGRGRKSAKVEMHERDRHIKNLVGGLLHRAEQLDESHSLNKALDKVEFGRPLGKRDEQTIMRHMEDIHKNHGGLATVGELTNVQGGFLPLMLSSLAPLALQVIPKIFGKGMVGAGVPNTFADRFGTGENPGSQGDYKYDKPSEYAEKLQPTVLRGAGNPWLEHVRKVQKEKGISYKEALKVAKASYKK